MAVLARPSAPSFSVLDPTSRSFAWRLGAVFAGALFLTLSSYVVVPMYPVPTTMQTFAVMLVGAVYGWRLGAVTILAWLAEAAAGLPVLAGGAGGLAHFAGPTAGYLLAFPIAGATVGWLAERGWNGRRFGLALAAMLIGAAICLAIGFAWLSVLIGMEKAFALGVAPFVVAAAAKAVLAAAALGGLDRLRRRSA